jgi:hypothetical protein
MSCAASATSLGMPALGWGGSCARRPCARPDERRGTLTAGGRDDVVDLLDRVPQLVVRVRGRQLELGDEAVHLRIGPATSLKRCPWAEEQHIDMVLPVVCCAAAGRSPARREGPGPWTYPLLRPRVRLFRLFPLHAQPARPGALLVLLLTRATAPACAPRLFLARILLSPVSPPIPGPGRPRSPPPTHLYAACAAPSHPARPPCPGPTLSQHSPRCTSTRPLLPAPC